MKPDELKTLLERGRRIVAAGGRDLALSARLAAEADRLDKIGDGPLSNEVRTVVSELSSAHMLFEIEGPAIHHLQGAADLINGALEKVPAEYRATARFSLWINDTGQLKMAAWWG